MKWFWQMIMVGSIALALSGCEPKVSERGKLDIDLALEKIQPNISTQADVTEILGSPSSTSQFGDKAWYYIASIKEGYAFMAPEVVEQEVLKFTFSGDTVATVEHFTRKDGQDVAFSDRETPTEGKAYGFFEQLLGNIGRFNKQRDSLGGS